VLLIVLIVGAVSCKPNSARQPKKQHGRIGSEDFLYFWQVTDPHIDSDYVQGSVANCNDIPICCRADSKNSNPNEPLDRAGLFGHNQHGNCDIPLSTFEHTVQFVKQYFDDDFKSENELFVFYGGDNLAHDDWNYSKEKNREAMLTVHKSLLKILRPSSGSISHGNVSHSSLLLSAIGNHDGFPIDQFDYSPGNSWFLDPFTDIMKQSGIVDAGAFDTMKYAGYYTVKVRDGLRALIMNTQWQDPLNFFLYKDTNQDPAGQLAFVKQVLSNAQKNQERVLILGHIPPGIDDRSPTPMSIPSFNTQFQQIIDQFSDVVILQTYGHTHTDSFRVLMDYETNTVPKSVAFVTPSVTTWTDQNPSVRLFKLEKKYPYNLVDVVTFISNVTQANMEGEMKFEVEYSAKQAYNMVDMSPQSWYGVANQLISNDTVWKTFTNYFHAKFARDNCQNKCRLAQYCSTVYMQMQSYAQCILH